MTDTPLRIALRQTIEGLLPIIPNDSDMSPTGNGNLLMLMQVALENIDVYPTDKISRWIGFTQGVLSVKGLLDVKAERDRTRPFFHAAYAEMSVEIPQTL